MKSERGFSLVELLVVITIIGILAAIAIPNMVNARNKARETEVKANLHSIQAAIERFYVDEKEYPGVLIGGDQNSWSLWHTKAWSNPNIDDPLIKGNYIDSYPKNPFVDEANGAVYLQVSGGDLTTPGSGDPRFGMKGTVMPNSVDDPMWFMAPGGVVETIDPSSTHLIQNYFGYGGMKTGTGEPTINIIQGSFFYRAVGAVDMFTSTPSGSPTRRDFRYTAFDHYILGGFGSDTTKGVDVIRLTGTGTYRKWQGSTFPYDLPILLPEVYGGGSVNELPYFPYEPTQPGVTFPYGAPDGYDDGVIIVLTDSSMNIDF